MYNLRAISQRKQNVGGTRGYRKGDLRARTSRTQEKGKGETQLAFAVRCSLRSSVEAKKDNGPIERQQVSEGQGQLISEQLKRRVCLRSGRERRETTVCLHLVVRATPRGATIGVCVRALKKDSYGEDRVSREIVRAL